MADIVQKILSPISFLFPPTATYSCLDLTGAINHPSIGAYNLIGEGIGDITISMATDRTMHEIGVDGVVLATQIPGNNGTLTLNLQQTSALNRWLIKWVNHLNNKDTARNEWLMATALIKSKSLQCEHKFSGLSPQKIPDLSYQAQGQRIKWVLMAADIQTIKGGVSNA
jgi:hypothetical protein